MLHLFFLDTPTIYDDNKYLNSEGMFKMSFMVTHTHSHVSKIRCPQKDETPQL